MCNKPILDALVSMLQAGSTCLVTAQELKYVKILSTCFSFHSQEIFTASSYGCSLSSLAWNLTSGSHDGQPASDQGHASSKSLNLNLCIRDDQEQSSTFEKSTQFRFCYFCSIFATLIKI